jgi:hypothetical protein
LFIEVYRELVPADLVTEDTGSLDRDLEVLLTRLSELYCNTPAGNILSGLIAEAQTVPELAGQLRETYVVPRRAIIGSIFARALARREIDTLIDSELASDLISGAVWFRLLLGERQLDRKFKRHLIDTILKGLARGSAQAAPGSRGQRRGREPRQKK